MAEPLETYLHDHYSGSTFAVELLESMRDKYKANELGQFAGQILAEIEEDRATLKRLIGQIGSSGPDLKDVSAWIAEKASRMKLNPEHPEDLGAFEALETIALGILGKRSLWAALRTLQETDGRLAGQDFDALVHAAEDQFERVEQCRLTMVKNTFAPKVAH